MKQFFLLGASSVYGVGGENGGWGELFKQHIHQKMYGPNGEGEKYEVFNFAKSGATVQFVLETFTEQIKNYGRDGEIVCIISVGGNNSKAVNQPNNYVSTVEEYTQQMTSLINLLKQNSSQVVIVSNGFVDESKTNPKPSPFDNSKSYFTNARRTQFQSTLMNLCNEMGVQFVDTDKSIEEWQANYLYDDGLHPNAKGHQLIFQSICNYLTV